MNKKKPIKPISLKKFNRLRNEKGTINAIAECYQKYGLTNLPEIAEALGELIEYMGNVREVELLESKKLTEYVNQYGQAILNEQAVRKEWCLK